MGFAGYCFFLTIFFVVATNRRDSDVYNFGQSVREIVQAQWFERIGGDTDYYEYLGLHFFPGLKDNSFERPDAKPFSLVGAPRIRAVRARQCDADDNGMSEYLDNVADGLLCLIPISNSDYETESFGGADGTFFKHWVDTAGADHPMGLDSSLLNSYGWEGGVLPQHTYPGSGYLVPTDIISELMQAPVDVSVHGTEFYPFPYEAIDVSILEEKGWWDPQTVALFHDLTVVSANEEMYCHVRMILEIGANHGLMKPSVHMSVVFLDDVSSWKVLLETIFMGYIIALIISEFKELWSYYAGKDGKGPLKELKEQQIEMRYRLRQRMLQYAAFQGIMVYNPQPVMRNLMYRLFVKYQDDGINVVSPAHINHLNSIGQDMIRVHEKWKGMRDTGYKPRDATGTLYHTEFDERRNEEVPTAMKVGEDQARQAAMAVIDLFDQVKKLHELRLRKEKLARLGRTGKCAWNQIRERLPLACSVYYRDPWNFLDSFNYLLFSISIWFRIQSLFHDIPKIQGQLDVMTDENRYSTFVDFSTFAWRDGVQSNLNAFNAILTWLKIFKCESV